MNEPLPAAPRVLLLELQSEDAFRSHRAEVFPYLLGLLHEHGLPGAWWVVTVPDATMHAGGRYVVDVPPEALARLTEALNTWKPSLVVLSDRLAPDGLEAVRGAAPGARLVQAPEDDAVDVSRSATLRLLEAGEWSQGPDDDPVPLVDSVAPCFERRPLVERVAAPGQPGHPLQLLARSVCTYRDPVSANPYFREVPGPLAAGHLGCSFCPRARPAATPRRPDDPIPRILAQIEAHQRSEPRRELPFEYHCEDIRVFHRLEEVARSLLQKRLRPVHLYLMVRADELLRAQGRLERVLPLLATGGHGLRVVSIGAENFSRDENERFNKGLAPEQLFACHRLVVDLARRFPGAFLCPTGAVFSSILWTPWTTPADLLANVDAGDTLGEAWLQGALGMRLQLVDDVPITALARHDGLTVEHFGELGMLVANCISRADRHEQPWRFADPRTATVFRLLVRLDPIQTSVRVPDDDPLVRHLRDLRRALPEPADFGYVALVRGLVQAVVALGPDATAEALVGHALSQWLRRDAPGSAATSYSRALEAIARIRASLSRSSGTLDGYRLTAHAVAKRGGGYVACVRFQREARELALEIAARAPGERTWLAGRRHGLTTTGGDAPPSEAERRFGQALLHVLEPTHASRGPLA